MPNADGLTWSSLLRLIATLFDGNKYGSFPRGAARRRVTPCLLRTYHHQLLVQFDLARSGELTGKHSA